MATPPITAPVMPDGLAVPPIGVVRSRVKMDAVTNTEARLQRAKERLYVLCQAGGWIFFLVLQVVFIALFRSQDTAGRATPSDIVMSLVRVIAEGLLVTHYARIYLTRWGWKDLGWRPLIPRILGLAIAMSAIWTAAGFALDFGLLRIDPPTKFPLWLLMTSSLVNGAIMMTGWLCIYFFYHLFERLNRLQLEQLKLAATVKEAELRALKSQVNPHFLFNSLNSLRALIDEDAPRAREAVTRLANMLRYSLQSGQQELVPFDDEIRIVEDYLALEQIRHESRLRVRWEITPEARGLHVPPMLLQTLVENAVKYGISTRRDGGELVISAHRVASELNIRVTNPGDLAAPTSAAAARAGSSTGVGLRNATERLKLLFGERATLILRPEPAGCVTADVSIPLTATPQ
ncbi:MAG TPA: histidine kinase [Lacunisphaera sp.]|jgi:signal transduction histidine kinase|nr:histidine kinase [Lacunisphaera sp.]HQY06998.1 histidine kinase [Lacunisphaera sp.]